MIWLIVLAGLILRTISINQSLWIDEATSALVVKNNSYIEIVTKFIRADFHPPLYYLILKFWTSVFGLSEIGLRSLSVVLALILILIIFAIAKELFNKKVGLIASIFFAINGLSIYYSQEARMYMMSAVIVGFLSLLYIKIIKKSSIFPWFMFSVMLVINFYTDYLPNFIIIVFWIYSFLTIRDLKWWKKFIVAHIPLLLAFILWIPYLMSQLAYGLAVKNSSSLWFSVLGKTTFKDLMLVPVKFIYGRISLDNRLLYFAIFGLGTLIFAYVSFVAIKRSLQKVEIWLIILWITIPVLFSALIGLYLSVFSYFRLIFILPAFCLLLAVGLDNFKKRCGVVWTTVIGMVFLLSSCAYLFIPEFHREDWRGFVNLLDKSAKKQNDAVVFSGSGQKEAYIYYKGRDDSVAVDQISDEIKSIWLVRYVSDITDPKNDIPKDIQNKNFVWLKEYNLNGVIVWHYIKT